MSSFDFLCTVINTCVNECTSADMMTKVFSTSADGECPPSASSATVNHIKIEPIGTMDL